MFLKFTVCKFAVTVMVMQLFKNDTFFGDGGGGRGGGGVRGERGEGLTSDADMYMYVCMWWCVDVSVGGV